MQRGSCFHPSTFTVSIGIIFARYNAMYKKYHKLSLSILKEFGFGVERVMETRILEEVESLNEELRNLNGRPFDPKWPITTAVSRVVLSILFGKNFLKSHPKDLSIIVETGVKFFLNMDYSIDMVPVLRFLPALRRKIEGLRKVNQNLLNSIEAGITLIKSNKSEPTFVERFLEVEGAAYNHQDLLYVLRDLCLGGTDTAPTTLEWAMVELANHPVTQNRIQVEIDEMVPGDRLPSLDDKSRLPYTEAVILEVMRRHIISKFFIRHTSLKEAKVLGYDIPNGCQVSTMLFRSISVDGEVRSDVDHVRSDEDESRTGQSMIRILK